MTDLNRRRPIGKGLRFDIFRRDGFTCRYCGHRPPDVVLEIDHLIPVIDGGDNSESNLLTSCEECNRGKGKKPASAIPATDVDPAYLEIEQETVEMRRYLEVKKARDAAFDILVKELGDTFCKVTGADWYPTAIADWVRAFGPDLVEEAVYIVAPKWRGGKFGRDIDLIKYMRGTLNNLLQYERRA